MGSRDNIVAIKKLTLETRMKSVVCGRVGKLWHLKEWKNGSIEKARINFELTDESGSIEVCFFDTTARVASKFLKNNVLIRIENFKITTMPPKHENLQLTSLHENFKEQTVVNELHDPVLIEKLEWRTINLISEIATYKKGTFTDVMAVVTEIGKVETVSPKNGAEPYKKRSVVLLDTSNAKITLTFWRKDVAKFSSPLNSVLIIRNAQIGYYFGPCLNFANISEIEVNPQTVGATALRSWHQSNAGNVPAVSLTRGFVEPIFYRCVRDIQTEANNDTVRYVSVNLRPTFFTGDPEKVSNHFYAACIQSRCNTEAEVLKSGRFWCPNCKKARDNYKVCMKLTAQFADPTGGVLATMFQNHLESVVPFSTSTLYIMSILDKASYKTCLDRFLIGKELTAGFKVTKNDKGNLHWSLLSLKKLSPCPGNSKPLPLEKNDRVDTLVVENAPLPPHLGLIEDVDAVPEFYREEQKSKLKKST